MNLIEFPDLVLTEIFQYFNPKMKLTLVLSCKRFHLFISKYILLPLNRVNLKVQVLHLDYDNSFERLVGIPMDFGLEHFAVKEVELLGRNTKFIFQFWSLSPAGETSPLCANPFALIFSLGPKELSIENLHLAMEKFGPRAEVFFRINFVPNSQWKTAMMGKWYNDDENMLAALVQKVEERYNALQQIYSSATVKLSGDANNNKDHNDNTPNSSNNNSKSKICQFL